MSKSSKSRTTKEHENKHSKGKSILTQNEDVKHRVSHNIIKICYWLKRAIPSSGRGKILDTKPKRKVMEAKLGK